MRNDAAILEISAPRFLHVRNFAKSYCLFSWFFFSFFFLELPHWKHYKSRGSKHRFLDHLLPQTAFLDCTNLAFCKVRNFDFFSKTDFSISVFSRGLCGNVAPNSSGHFKRSATRFAEKQKSWKFGGATKNDLVTNSDFFGRFTLGAVPVFCANAARNAWGGEGWVLGSEWPGTLKPRQQKMVKHFFWLLLSPEPFPSKSLTYSWSSFFWVSHPFHLEKNHGCFPLIHQTL